MRFSWSPFPLLRIAILFIIGIAIYDWKPQFPTIFEWFVAGLIVFGVIGFWLKEPIMRGAFLFSLVIILGYSSAYFQDPLRDFRHLSHGIPDGINAYQGVVVGEEVERENYDRYNFEIDQVLTDDSTFKLVGQIYLYISKDTTRGLNYGDRLLVVSNFSSISTSRNPEVFDYGRYLKKGKIYGQSFVDSEQIYLKSHEPPNVVYAYFLKLRHKCRSILNRSVIAKREQQIAQALLIGVKDYLTLEVKSAYSATGAMHILAVSGLHVGIIYLFLLVIIKPIKSWPFGRVITFGILVLCIWGYAALTGLSPSVMRAALMFTIVALGDLSAKESSIYNSLGLSALVLLLYDSNLLFAVGFQLSFAAVFGIVYFYPKLYRLVNIDLWIFDKIWSISCVSIAAQLSTFLLSIYYFNQFPTYFLLSNLFAIPGATILLLLGIPLLISGFVLPSVSLLLGQVLEFAIFWLNEAIFSFEKLPGSLVSDLYLQTAELWILYPVLILSFLAVEYRSFSCLLLTTFFALWWTGITISRQARVASQLKLIGYSVPGATVFDVVEGRESSLFYHSSTKPNISNLQFQVDPFRRSGSLPTLTSEVDILTSDLELRRVGPFQFFWWHGIRIAFLDQKIDTYAFPENLQVDVLILSNDAVTDLLQIDSAMNYRDLIVSSDYSSSVLRQVLLQSKQLEIPIHSLTKDGYWMLDLNKPQKDAISKYGD
ncbi:MAG: competence protein ComEC [Cyclobacteriaceae bacterium]|jgi:competence protein ComEC